MKDKNIKKQNSDILSVAFDNGGDIIKYTQENEDIINDQVRDIAISIVDELVNEGIVKDCTDTDCEAEFICQDIIVEHLLNDRAKSLTEMEVSK